MMTKQQLACWVMGCLAGIYQPMPKETIWEWAERTLKIPRGGENDEMAGQPWSSKMSPYVRPFMEWFRLPGKLEFFIRKSSQVGITMAALIVICWHIVHKPVNIGYCIDSVEEARKISKTRLKRWIKENKLLDQVNESEDDLANMTYFLRSMTVYLMGSYAEGAFRNKALAVGLLDELDAHPPVDEQGTTADNMRARTKRNRNSKIAGWSTPKLEKDQTTVEFLGGTQEWWTMPCPCCGLPTRFTQDQLRCTGPEFEDLTGEPDMEVVLEKAYLVCESKGCRIEHSQKYEMMDLGWEVATAKPVKPNKRSMQLNDFYSNFVTWGQMAVEWIEAQTNLDKLRAYTQQRLGEPFRMESGTVKEHDVLQCRDQGFKKGGKIPYKLVLSGLLTDTQQSTLKWAKIGYTATGDMIVCDWGETPDWDELERLAHSSIPTVFGDYPIECGFVDEGDGNRAEEVRRFTERPGLEHVFPVKGRGETQIKELLWPSISRLGDDEVLTYHVNDPIYKNELIFGRIKKGEKRRDWGKRRLILPKDVTPEFVAELLGERFEKVKNKYKWFVEKWVKTGINDYLDVCKYGLALWDLMEPRLREVGRIGAAAPVEEEETRSDESAVPA